MSRGLRGWTPPDGFPVRLGDLAVASAQRVIGLITDIGPIWCVVQTGTDGPNLRVLTVRLRQATEAEVQASRFSGVGHNLFRRSA